MNIFLYLYVIICHILSIYNIKVTKKGVNSFKLNGKEIEEKKIKLSPNGGVYQLDVTI